MALLTAACGSELGADRQQSTSDTPAGDTAPDEGTPVDGGSLVVGVANDATGWNPVEAQWADTGSLVGSSVLEPLATIGPDKGGQAVAGRLVDRQRDLRLLGHQDPSRREVPER